ncbi:MULTISPECIES: peptide chain release factor 3 [Rossellomorea]|uniref:Peptide chain release factor 3 n=1 Tax=Rossellomorea vietnamensis TaxID=218284 RepID=A0A6I6UGH4_9BACI|nr:MULTISPECIES: peptide chain release factor 3 [Rossellomorea]OXS55705.1 peptide chain release factor 3 [Bacillus sp. DSM 27956]PRX71187.1 peptide chain release factor 3 (bRF-3) [Bacillus sp. V-88]MCA0148890.1 peptide chain release factor 3 [Rossellomorea vietnamensis]QHE61058.1 peptide chain release factor 3 [Rossellomorea vietnamensis]UTE79209.1 peptide chain release factor 3 [Rossellomorea sp. KS-H15a]
MKIDFIQEVQSRRTFAIISHPDAGKTTLTEQLLLFGGAIRAAGTVKGKKSGKFATSDWMEIEKQRGISVTSSVMAFDYDDYRVNILDTPGHQDFSEDTYRTLMAVDSAVMIIDSAKGIEAQTLKLFKVCRMRGIPIFTFINKLDRQGREPLELLEELEEVLGIQSYPMNWPIGMGKEFLGIYDRFHNRIEQFRVEEDDRFIPLNDEGEIEGEHPLKESNLYNQTLEDVLLLNEAGNQFSRERIANGELSPVFFGSALTNFGVQTFLETYLQFAPSPQPRNSDAGEIEPTAEDFSGFVFKIQANMNPAHRDRIAFVRICSGQFERGMTVNLSRTGKSIKLAQSTQFLADDRSTVNEAVSGDIIGVYDTGTYQIGDTLVQGKQGFQYEKLPQFTPELFVRVTAKNVMKQKHFQKGILQLVQEGAIQYYKTRTEDIILGAVGQLQFEVFEHRMKNEYNVDVKMEPIGSKIARWIENEEDVKETMSSSRSMLVKDRHDNLVFLFENDFAMRWFNDKNPDIRLYSLM